MKKVHVRLLLCLSSYLFGYLWLSQPVRVAVADPGDLDTTFGVDYDGDSSATPDGYYLSDTGVNGLDMSLHSNGYIYVVGGVSGCSAGSAPFGMLSRFVAMGSLDTAFGNDYDSDSELDGYVRSRDDTVSFRAVAKDSSENLIAVGSVVNASGNKDVTIKSFNVDGTETALAEYDKGYGDDEANAVVIDSSGRIVVAATLTGAVSEFAVVMRFNSDGSLDSTFGTGGQVYATEDGLEKLFGLVLDYNDDGSDYEIIAVGTKRTASNSKVLVVKLDSFGAPVADFGDSDGAEDNVLLIDFYESSDVALDVALGSDDSLYFTGYRTDEGGDEDVFLAKYDKTGAPDTSFGTSGIAILDSGYGDDEAYAIALDSQGSVLVAGTLAGAEEDSFFVSRFDSVGALDVTFGEADSSGTAKKGYTTLTAVSSSDYRQIFNRIILDSSENILALGTSQGASVVSEQLVLAKFEGGYSTAVCGDGVLASSESCDDGNSTDDDGCSSDCEIEVDADGDGYYVGEDCDDSDADIYEGCDAGDDDDDDGDGDGDVCGDGTKGSTEACDDGNLTSGDGCTSACMVESDADGDGYYGVNDCDDTDKSVHENCANPSKSPTEGGGGCGCVLTAKRPTGDANHLMLGSILVGWLVYRRVRQKAEDTP